MLLCYSFVQFVIRLFDDLNDDAEYHYIYPAPDVDVQRRMSMCVAVCRRAVTDVDDWTGVFLTHVDVRGCA